MGKMWWQDLEKTGPCGILTQEAERDECWTQLAFSFQLGLVPWSMLLPTVWVGLFSVIN